MGNIVQFDVHYGSPKPGKYGRIHSGILSKSYSGNPRLFSRMPDTLDTSAHDES